MSQLIIDVNNQEQIVIEDGQEFLDILVELDQEKTGLLLTEADTDTDTDTETVEQAEVMAEAMYFLSEAVLGYLDYQLEEGLISQINYIKTRAIFENALAYDISIIESEDDDLEDEDEEDLIAEVAAELEAGAAETNAAISESVQELIGELSLVQELVYHKTIRHGILKKLLVCPVGWRSHGGRCIKMGATEVRRRMRASIKANRTKKREFKNSNFRNMLMKLRNKSLRIRKQKNLK